MFSCMRSKKLLLNKTNDEKNKSANPHNPIFNNFCMSDNLYK